MTNKTVKPKCHSKIIPCPAGERCPEHRGRSEAIIKALKNSDIKTAALLKKEELDVKEKQQLASFLKEMNVKLKKDGSSIITVTEHLPIYEKRTWNARTTVYRNRKQKIVAPPVHPAEVIDKTHRIVPNNTTLFYAGVVVKTPDEAMQSSLDQIYDGNVTISTSSTFSTIAVNVLDIADDYKGHGVESHVIASIVASRRPDLYDFVSKANISYDEYEKAGFEPNPYYWAGKIHTETGKTYPTVEELNKFCDRNTPNYVRGEYSNLQVSKETQEYPYIRIKHGFNFNETPLTIIPYSKEVQKKLNDLRGDRNYRTFKSTAAHNVLDIR